MYGWRRIQTLATKKVGKVVKSNLEHDGKALQTRWQTKDGKSSAVRVFSWVRKGGKCSVTTEQSQSQSYEVTLK